MSQEPTREGPGAAAKLRSLFSVLLTLLLVGASAVGLYNVFGVREEILALASQSACEGQAPDCKAQLLFLDITPFSHTYRLSTPKGTSLVTCKRPLIFAGSFACTSASDTVPGGAAAAPSASVKAGPGKSAPSPKGSR